MTDLAKDVASGVTEEVAADIQVSAMDLTKNAGSKVIDKVGENPISALDLAKKSDGAKGQQSSESVEPPQLEVRVNLVRWRPDSGSPPPTTHEIADQEKEPQSETSQEKITTQELRPTLLSYHSQVAYENLEKDVQCQLLVKRLAKVREGVPPGMVIDTIFFVALFTTNMGYTVSSDNKEVFPVKGS